jgi:hypothetical protein
MVNLSLASLVSVCVQVQASRDAPSERYAPFIRAANTRHAGTHHRIVVLLLLLVHGAPPGCVGGGPRLRLQAVREVRKERSTSTAFEGEGVRTSTTVVRETGAPVGGLRGPGEEGGPTRALASPDSRFGWAAPTATRHRERDSESSTSPDSLPPVSASRTCGSRDQVTHVSVSVTPAEQTQQLPKGLRWGPATGTASVLTRVCWEAGTSRAQRKRWVALHKHRAGAGHVPQSCPQ